MALSIGSPAADAGLSRAIFVELDGLLSPPLQEAVDKAPPEAKSAAQEALTAARNGWRHLAFAIAKGVVEHLVLNLEIRGVTVAGTVNVPVNTNTGSAAAATPHAHGISINPLIAVSLLQNNDGPGRVI